MKVLFLTNIPSPYRVDFFNELSKYCELTVLYERTNASDRNASWEQAKDGIYSANILKGIHIAADSALCLGVLKYLSKKRYDIIVIGGYSTPTSMLAMLFMRMLKIPFVINADGGFVRENEKRLLYKFKCFWISGASWWLSTGPKTSSYLIHYGADSNRILTYPFTSLRKSDILSAPVSKEEKQEIRVKLGIYTKTLFLGVGQFIPRKGFDEFLREWVKASRPDMGLILIGGGEQEALYKEIAVGNDNIWILPFCGKDGLTKYYHTADALVLPTHEDIWGLVINEALASGLPVFSTDKCVAACTFASDNVKTLPAGDFVSFVEELERFAKEMNHTAQSTEALAQIKDYTIENMALAHMEHFNRIAADEN